MPEYRNENDDDDDDEEEGRSEKNQASLKDRKSEKKEKKEKKDKKKKKKKKKVSGEEEEDVDGAGDVEMTDANATARGGDDRQREGRVHLLAHEVQSTPDYSGKEYVIREGGGDDDDLKKKVHHTEMDAIRFKAFLDGIRIEVKSLNDDTMEFDLIGVDASFANTLRRVLIAEVPSVAIEKVLIADNTSIIPDEVLAHRLGLIPINADPRKLSDYALAAKATDRNTIVFKLLVECTRNALEDTIENERVKSQHLKWLPRGSEFPCSDGDPQAQRRRREALQQQPEDGDNTPTLYTEFSESQEVLFPSGVRAVDDDILIAKLSPGQRIHLEAHAIKGVGKEHAKWSPVATAWYRMHPEILIADDVVDDVAEKLKAKCDMFDVEERNGRKVAVVVDPRTSRACPLIHDPEWKDRIQINRVKNHFIFTVESTGALSPPDLVRLAFEVLQQKIDKLLGDELCNRGGRR